MSDDQEFTDDDGVKYDLVMPFTVVQSRGGPYEDEAFVAGWACGEIMAKLERTPMWKGIVREQALPQVDLIAMHYGLRMTHEEHEALEPGWAQVTIA